MFGETGPARPGPNTMRLSEVMLTVFEEAGFPLEEADRAVRDHPRLRGLYALRREQNPTAHMTTSTTGPTRVLDGAKPWGRPGMP